MFEIIRTQPAPCSRVASFLFFLLFEKSQKKFLNDKEDDFDLRTKCKALGPWLKYTIGWVCTGVIVGPKGYKLEVLLGERWVKYQPNRC